MFNYETIIENHSMSQGYCLGLESYHRLNARHSIADHYSRLASDFNKALLKIKNRALKHGLKKSFIDNVNFIGINKGKKQFSKSLQ